jgi:hypothetical protein
VGTSAHPLNSKTGYAVLVFVKPRKGWQKKKKNYTDKR